MTLMSAWHGVMADEEKFLRRKISTDTVYNTLKKHIQNMHTPFAVDPHLTMSSVFGTGRSANRDLFMSERRSSRNILYQLSYLERNIYADLIAHLDVIVNQAEHQYERRNV